MYRVDNTRGKIVGVYAKSYTRVDLAPRLVIKPLRPRQTALEVFRIPPLHITAILIRLFLSESYRYTSDNILQSYSYKEREREREIARECIALCVPRAVGLSTRCTNSVSFRGAGGQHSKPLLSFAGV